jgi:hypothetical protein
MKKGKNMKTINVLMAVVCIFATLGLASVNAASPRYFKQVNLVYSTDGTNWTPVAGNQVSDFKLKLDGSATTWYYLNIKFIKPLQPDGLYPFYLTPPTDAAFWAYWQGRGVYSGCVGTWEPIMWLIITGQQPMFYLSASGGTYMLVDGLQYLASGGSVINNLRLNGDYPLGSYTFTCDTAPLSDIAMTIMFR